MADDEGEALGIVMGGDVGERAHGGVVGMFRGDEEILEKVGGVRIGKVGRDVLAWKRQNRIVPPLHEKKVGSNVNETLERRSRMTVYILTKKSAHPIVCWVLMCRERDSHAML